MKPQTPCVDGNRRSGNASRLASLDEEELANLEVVAARMALAHKKGNWPTAAFVAKFALAEIRDELARRESTVRVSVEGEL